MHNFGKIKHTIYEVAIDGIVTKDPKKKGILKEYVKLLKSDRILRAECRIYNNLETTCNENDGFATEYIKENIALVAKYGLENLSNANRKLEILLEGYQIIEDYDQKELHENIHKLITTKKTFNTIHEIVESIKYLKDYIITNKKPEKVMGENYLPNSIMSKFLVEKFNSKYSHLEGAEREIAKAVISGDEKIQESALQAVKSEVLLALNETIKNNEDDIDLRIKLLDVKERILETKFNKDTFISDVAKISNLRNIL